MLKTNPYYLAFVEEIKNYNGDQLTQLVLKKLWTNNQLEPLYLSVLKATELLILKTKRHLMWTLLHTKSEAKKKILSLSLKSTAEYLETEYFLDNLIRPNWEQLRSSYSDLADEQLFKIYLDQWSSYYEHARQPLNLEQLHQKYANTPDYVLKTILKHEYIKEVRLRSDVDFHRCHQFFERVFFGNKIVVWDYLQTDQTPILIYADEKKQMALDKQLDIRANYQKYLNDPEITDWQLYLQQQKQTQKSKPTAAKPDYKKS
ncbi:hypothetical protein [Mycoplasmoides fastidiosum]|uniref:hypothetical protein n=1 Tax=Mycoplasmoides fastidiosum TaxID=92758 RepID=UPI002113A3C8|nr:hypothetical protein [Mycoplasmoides fastidiosum]UUD38093.1 hypothetical protein NPA10_01770 [Mycoplasmoides fastidiosum]